MDGGEGVCAILSALGLPGDGGNGGENDAASHIGAGCSVKGGGNPSLARPAAPCGNSSSGSEIGDVGLKDDFDGGDGRAKDGGAERLLRRRHESKPRGGVSVRELVLATGWYGRGLS